MKPKVLVLDDQLQYCRSLDRALRAEYEVITATSVEEARCKFSPEVRVLLADVRLDESRSEDRTGLEFVSWVRGQAQRLPVVVMSALEDESIEQHALAVGATRFLRKPIVVSDLRAMLRELTGV